MWHIIHSYNNEFDSKVSLVVEVEVEGCYNSFQGTGLLIFNQNGSLYPNFVAAVLHWLKIFDPKKPLWADSGDGCGAVMTGCFFLSISLDLFLAQFPNSTNTTPG